MYIKVTNGVAGYYTLRQLRKDNPNSSFPEEPTLALLSDWDVYPYTPANLPDYDMYTQVCDDLGLIKVGAVYSENYVVRDKTQEELALYVVNAAEAERIKRSASLIESDWTQIADAPVDKAVWATYRQELRDIPEQDGFPTSVVWPVKP